MGILLTMFDRRNRLSFQVDKEIRSYFGPVVFETRIPRNVRLSESPSFGKPAILYDVAAAGRWPTSIWPRRSSDASNRTTRLRSTTSPPRPRR